MRSQNTPHMGHPPIKMRDVGEVSRLRARGDFCWTESEEGRRLLHIMVPALYAGRCCYTRWTIGKPFPNGEAWQWDGNIEKPTLRPELHARTVWRGKVSSGMLIEAPAE